MTEDRKDEVAVEEKTEDVVEEKTEDVAEEKTEDTLPDIVNKIRGEYEIRIAEMEAKHAAAIADRDEIIAQLIGGNNQDSDATRTPFVERLNNKRNYKKW